MVVSVLMIFNVFLLATCLEISEIIEVCEHDFQIFGRELDLESVFALFFESLTWFILLWI